MVKNIYLAAAGRTVKWIAIGTAVFFGFVGLTYVISHLFNIAHELALLILFFVTMLGMLYNIQLDSIRWEKRRDEF
jgi:hypothetical protein